MAGTSILCSGWDGPVCAGRFTASAVAAGPVARVLVGAAAEWLEGGSLAHWFDAVVHVRDTTPVHLLPNTDD